MTSGDAIHSELPDARLAHALAELAELRGDVRSCAQRLSALQKELHQQQHGLQILEDRVDEHDRDHAAAATALQDLKATAHATQDQLAGVDSKTDKVLVLLEALKDLYQPRAVL